MYLKREGTILISSILILFLMTTLGTFIFKMMVNNYEMSQLYKFDKNLRDLEEHEEIVLYDFMKELNVMYKEKDDISENIFANDFNIKSGNNTLTYYKDEDQIILKICETNGDSRERELKYVLKNGEVILIPTFTFKDENINS